MKQLLFIIVSALCVIADPEVRFTNSGVNSWSQYDTSEYRTYDSIWSNGRAPVAHGTFRTQSSAHQYNGWKGITINMMDSITYWERFEIATYYEYNEFDYGLHTRSHAYMSIPDNQTPISYGVKVFDSYTSLDSLEDIIYCWNQSKRRGVPSYLKAVNENLDTIVYYFGVWYYITEFTNQLFHSTNKQFMSTWGTESLAAPVKMVIDTFYYVADTVVIDTAIIDTTPIVIDTIVVDTVVVDTIPVAVSPMSIARTRIVPKEILFDALGRKAIQNKFKRLVFKRAH